MRCLITLLCSSNFVPELIQNETIEERVALLEIQVADIEEDVINTRIDLSELEGDVNFLFDEQVIQDERLLGLEQGINIIESDLDVIDDEIESGCPLS